MRETPHEAPKKKEERTRRKLQKAKSSRDYHRCLKLRKEREGEGGGGLFLPAGSRDDGVCPRGRSILRESWIACEYAAGEKK